MPAKKPGFGYTCRYCGKFFEVSSENPVSMRSDGPYHFECSQEKGRKERAEKERNEEKVKQERAERMKERIRRKMLGSQSIAKEESR